MPISRTLWSTVLLALSIAVREAVAQTGTIADVEHVVLFMQENRAFDHYFGTMAGVRGFGDPNVHVASNGREVWYQQVNASFSTKTTELLPFYINAAGGDLYEATQCMIAGSNDFYANHEAYAGGDNNQWVLQNTVYSWGHFQQSDIPTHWDIANTWTIGDMYTEAVVAVTHPNRAFWASGSINVPGGPQSPGQGGTFLDNWETDGCEAPGIDCYPLMWKTFPEYLQDAGVSWQVYQNESNFDDNPVAWFSQFIDAPADSPLAQRGMAFLGLDQFTTDALAGNLPAVSYVIGPGELSEHPPYTPREGGWFQQQIVNAVINSPKYNSTALIISYDESGGWGDHVIPITSPPNTPGEWLTNPFNTSTTTFAGPGFRLPFYVISPWTRGGNVFTAHSDHSSQFMFIEKWLAAKGINVQTTQLNAWRRENMDDLVGMFDFANPDYSVPQLAQAPAPPIVSGQYAGTAVCQQTYSNPQPPIPYGEQTREDSLTVNNGYKSVRGALTEGRYLVFEANGKALGLNSAFNGLATSAAAPEHNIPTQRFILHATAQPPATTFTLQFAGAPLVPLYIGGLLGVTTDASDATVFNIVDQGNGKGYTIQDVSTGRYVALGGNADSVALGDAQTFSVYAVSYSTDSGTGF